MTVNERLNQSFASISSLLERFLEHTYEDSRRFEELETKISTLEEKIAQLENKEVT